MSLPTALVRNFLSACKPWAPSEISRMYIESGVLSTLGLGSFFSFYEAIHDLSSGLKNFHRFSIISRNIDRLSLNISGSEICIVRHGVGRKIWDSQHEIMFGIVKLIFGVGFAYMTIAVRGGYFSNNIYVNIVLKYCKF